MLILTRKPGESIIIGDNVTVTILGVRGNQVRLGTEAPIEISVHREEIYHRIKKENELLKETDCECEHVWEAFDAGVYLPNIPSSKIICKKCGRIKLGDKS